jgi:myo-inositol-1-phosphate synthase
MKEQIQKPDGKLGILIPGLGAVATTLIAGVEAIKKGLSQPIGSLTQMGNIRVGKRTENRSPLIKDFVPLADLQDIVFMVGISMKTMCMKRLQKQKCWSRPYYMQSNPN